MTKILELNTKDGELAFIEHEVEHFNDKTYEFLEQRDHEKHHEYFVAYGRDRNEVIKKAIEHFVYRLIETEDSASHYRGYLKSLTQYL